ncbi:PAS domain-containing protein [Methylobacterium sp. SyP6R]|uniref:PAS domain-containing protein n=1 Tax=Methylobacterium sp. SyP6R TaxID=2718876 RepID=UPI001F2D0501|nr:PAS domain-containing protein [Methylobacterium sp. SyP6R]MCF4125841.1 PAS domain-containing protein [Methylobacterium sp. SyP6R]
MGRTGLDIRLRGLLDRLRALIVARRPSRPVRYGVPVLAVGGIALLHALVFSEFAPWFLFTPAVILIALLLGGGAGLWATLLSAACTGIALLAAPPVGVLSLTQSVASAVFVVTTAGVVGLVVALRHALVEAETSQAELRRSAAASAEREAFLESILASSTDCIKVLDLDGRLTFMSEGGQQVMEVSDFNAIHGCHWPDFWAGQGHEEAVAALAAARAGRARSFVGRACTMRGTPKWWHVALSPIRNPDGTFDRILSVSRDITALRESEEERDRFVRLAENSTDFIGMARTDGRVFYLNDAARRMVGLDRADLADLTITDFLPPEQVDTVMAEMLAAVECDGHWSGELTFRHFRTGAAIPVLYSAFPITDGEGRVVGTGTVTRDFRAHKAAEEELRLLNGELAHRLKNVLAVVQSVTRQTLRNATDLRNAGESLSARLVALGTATDVLTNAAWRSADLRQLIEGALSPHGSIGKRIRLAGPALTLQPQLAVALALALHELATNAAKYGSLSNDTGIVDVRWHEEGTGPEARFRLDWREQGGPPVTAPARRGFGSALIERTLSAYFGGTAEIDYRPDGLVFALDAPADAAILASEEA